MIDNVHIPTRFGRCVSACISRHGLAAAVCKIWSLGFSPYLDHEQETVLFLVFVTMLIVTNSSRTHIALQFLYSPKFPWRERKNMQEDLLLTTGNSIPIFL
jgi:hypothetical protein